MGWFQITRNTELSTIEHIQTQIDANWNNVSVVKTFKEVSRNPLPVICVRCSNIIPITKEIGNTKLKKVFSFIIDIFAKSDGQRLDLSDSVLSYLEPGWTYYAYSQASGDSSTLDKVAGGKINLDEVVEDGRLDFVEQDLSEYDRYRHVIAFAARTSL